MHSFIYKTITNVEFHTLYQKIDNMNIPSNIQHNNIKYELIVALCEAGTGNIFIL